MKGISHAIQEVAPGETGVVIPTITHTHIHKRRMQMTALIMTAKTIGLHSVAEWFKRTNAKLKARHLANQTVKELSRLGDRELNDMGLSRCDIHYIAEKHYEEMVSKAALKGWM